MAKATTLKLPTKQLKQQFLEVSKEFLLECNERSRLIVTNLRTLVRGGLIVSGKKILAFDRIGLVPDSKGDLHLSCILYYEGGDKAFMFKEGAFMDLKAFSGPEPHYVMDHAGYLRVFDRQRKLRA